MNSTFAKLPWRRRLKSMKRSVKVHSSSVSPLKPHLCWPTSPYIRKLVHLHWQTMVHRLKPLSLQNPIHETNFWSCFTSILWTTPVSMLPTGIFACTSWICRVKRLEIRVSYSWYHCYRTRTVASGTWIFRVTKLLAMESACLLMFCVQQTMRRPSLCSTCRPMIWETKEPNTLLTVSGQTISCASSRSTTVASETRESNA
jgi:hypothetical protein